MITRLLQSNTYVLSPDGQRVAIFYTKVHTRLLQPLLAAHDLPAPLPLHQALHTIATVYPCWAHIVTDLQAG